MNRNIGKGMYPFLAIVLAVMGMQSVAMPVSAAGPGWSDNFNGAASQAWVVVNGGDNSTYPAQNNRYELHTESSGGSAKSLASFVNSSAADYIMQTRVQTIAPSDKFLAYLLARANTTTMSGYVMGASSDGSHFWFGKLTGGVYADLPPSHIEATTFDPEDVQVKFAVFGSTLVGKVWTTGTAEPDHWQIKATDSTYTSGVGGIMIATYPTLGWSVVQAAFDDVSLSTPAEVWVDDGWASNGPGDMAGGHTFGYDAFATIQAGVGAVDAGGTVNVAVGTYHEHVTISKALDLRGAQYGVDPVPGGARTNTAAESIIDLVGVPVTNPNVVVEIANGISNVSVAGFTLNGSPTSNYSDESVVRTFNNDLTVQYNIINGYVGVLLKGPGSNITVSRNRMTVNKNGIVAQPNSLSNVQVSGSKIVPGTAPAGDAAGLYFTSCTDCSVSSNTVTGFVGNNAIGGSNNTRLTINGNTFTGNKKGVSLWGNTTFLTVSNNTIGGSTAVGMDVKGDDITISNNFVTGGAAGIKIDKNTLNTERVTIRENDLSGNTGTGLEVTAAVVMTIDASANWWSVSDSALVKAKVSGNADYTPWLASGTDTSADPGFQGDLSTLWVDDDSPQTSTTGRIQEGINLVSGSTVNVAAGTYTEQVTIQKSLCLIGAGEATTTILAPTTRTGMVTHNGTIHDYLLAAYAPSGTVDVRVEGFTLDVNGQNKTSGTGQMDGVFFRNVKDTGGTLAGLFSSTIHNFATPKYEGFGVVVYGDSLLTVNDNNISDYTRDGISINRNGGSGSNPNVTISGNTITGSATPLNGINIGTVTAGAVTGNTVTGNTRTGDTPPDIWAAGGIVVWTSTGVPITGNHVNGNFYGINLQAGSHDITISGNELTDNIKRGITLDDSDNNTVSGNTIAGPVGGTDDVGIGVVNTSTGNMIGGTTLAAGNTITMAPSGSANLYAIHMQGDAGTGNTIRYNTITGGQRAVQFDGPPGITGITTVSNNVISGQAFGGILAYNNGDLVISDNTLTNAVRPIEFFGPVNLTVTGNTINGSTYAGINLGNFSGTATVSGNTIHGIAGNNGIRAQTWGAGLNITGNTIYDISGTGGGGRGIQIEPTADGANIDSNEIYNITGFTGICIDTGATGVKINNNYIHNNEQGVVANEQTAEFHGNRILNNRWGIDLNSATATFTLLHNQIAGNNTNPGDSYGLSVWAGTAIASGNWWGAASGPGTVGPGTGDKVSANVTYSPWCLNAACTATGTQNASGELVVDSTTTAPGVQELLNSVSSGAVIVLPATTLTPSGGFTISTPGITIKLSDGTVIQASSPCFTVSADNVTIKSDTFLGGVCEPSNGDNGIQTGALVNNLVIRNIEIRKGSGATPTTGDGIHIGHNVTNLQLLDNYIHGLDGDGIEYAAGVTVLGVHEVQGNLFQNNTGSGVNNQSGSAYSVKYNSWGDMGGPNAGSGDGAAGLLDFTPWTHVGLSMVSSVSPVADKVAVGQEIVYTIKMDAAGVYGADFDLNFNQDRLEVVSFANSGTFAQTADCKLNSVADANSNGELSFCGSRVSTGVLSGSGQDVFEVRFRGKSGITAPTGVSLNLDESDDQFAMSPPTGASTNIYAAILADGSVTVYPIFTVPGRIDLQGRADDTGAVLLFAQGSGADRPHYGPFTFSTSDYWGAISKAAVVEDTYGITVSMAKYLDVTTASNKSVSIHNAKHALNTLTLLGGDVGGGTGGTEDNKIDISDAAIIGNVYGTTTASGDVNGDGAVDILDLVLVGGNFDKQSSVALDNAYAAWIP